MIEYNHIDHPPQGNLLNILFESYHFFEYAAYDMSCILQCLQ